MRTSTLKIGQRTKESQLSVCFTEYEDSVCGTDVDDKDRESTEGNGSPIKRTSSMILKKQYCVNNRRVGKRQTFHRRYEFESIIKRMIEALCLLCCTYLAITQVGSVSA